MNKIYLLSSLLAAASIMPAQSEAASVEYGNRTFYGFFLTNGSYTNGQYGEYGFAKQKFNDLESNELIYRMGNNMGIYAAAAIDGVYYAAPYQFSTSLQPPEAKPMFTYNIYTGYVEEIGPWVTDDPEFKLWDMTYDRKNDRLLAVGYSYATGGAIYEVNRKTGQLTRLRSTEGMLLAADAFGRCFTITSDGDLYQLDMNNETRMIKLMNLPYVGQLSHQSLEFDLTNNKLYWASNTYTNPNGLAYTDGDHGEETRLIEITLPNIGPEQDYKEGGFSYADMGPIGSFATFMGMYIPFAPGGFMAPGHATDIKTVSSEDGKQCKITFKAPTITFGGEELTSIDGYDIFRDGVRIATRNGIQAGQICEYEDKDIPESREYRYDIVCYSSLNGDGPKTPAFAYVGFDRPAAVNGINVAIEKDFLKAHITWTAPEHGALGGTFDPAKTTYDIMRLPDNVQVAKDLATTEFTDNLRRLLRYSYQITAKNEYGESKAVSNEFVAGTPISSFPVEEPFDNPTAMLLKWTPVDNNADGTTWLFGSTLGHSVFGDYETCAEYILSPTSVTSDITDADEWLISPPIQFGDDSYSVQLTVRTFSPEHFNVYVGEMNTVEGMTLVQAISARKPVYDEDGRMLFQNYIVELPATMRNKTGCVAVQVDSKLPDDYVSYLQIANILVDTSSAIAAAVTEVDNETFSVSIGRDLIKVEGNYSHGAVYNMAGVKVCDLNGSETDITSLPGGVYLVTIDGSTYKVAR